MDLDLDLEDIQVAIPAKPRSRDAAVRTATMIQERLLIEEKILKDILDLLDTPAEGANPEQPTVEAVRMFAKAVKLFQPKDLDELIKERNIMDKCGYALCPQPKRKIKGGARKMIVAAPDGDMDIVDREELEKFCSETCGRRAMFVKAQLVETPAWHRTSGERPEIEIMVGDPAAYTSGSN